MMCVNHNLNYKIASTVQYGMMHAPGTIKSGLPTAEAYMHRITISFYIVYTNIYIYIYIYIYVYMYVCA